MPTSEVFFELGFRDEFSEDDVFIQKFALHPSRVGSRSKFTRLFGLSMR